MMVVGLIFAVPVVALGIREVVLLLADAHLELARRRRDRERRKSDADISRARWS